RYTVNNSTPAAPSTESCTLSPAPSSAPHGRLAPHTTFPVAHQALASALGASRLDLHRRLLPSVLAFVLGTVVITLSKAYEPARNVLPESRRASRWRGGVVAHSGG